MRRKYGVGPGVKAHNALARKVAAIVAVADGPATARQLREYARNVGPLVGAAQGEAVALAASVSPNLNRALRAEMAASRVYTRRKV